MSDARVRSGPDPRDPALLGFDAIVLAGGRGSRLGGAGKPGLLVGGRPLIASVVAAAGEAGAERLIVVGPEQAAQGLDGGRGLRLVREHPPGGGPVRALRRGLAESRELMVLLLAADLPFLTEATLRALLAAGTRTPCGAVLADHDDRPQWLVSCWRRPVLAAAAAGYPGSSLHGLLGPLGPATVRLSPPPGTPPPWLDCDTPEDLALAREWTASTGGDTNRKDR
jgi:molybdopterin-guanine dinucleotide biosynthesis protein A